MSNSNDDVPTCQMFFLERNVGTKTLNILHQVWQKPDGSQYLREVGKLSHSQANAQFGYARSHRAILDSAR